MSPENPEIANTAKKTQRGAGCASVTPVVEGNVVELMREATCRSGRRGLCRIGPAPKRRTSQFVTVTVACRARQPPICEAAFTSEDAFGENTRPFSNFT